MIQLFDLSQLISEPTCVTPTSATLIDHVYSTAPFNISESFVANFSISDHFPVCVTLKINNKIFKNDHITTYYRSFKNFDEELFLHELTKDLEKFTPYHLIVDDDFVIWFSLIVKQLNVHAPLKPRRVKAKRLPDWFTPDITEMQRKRDISRRLKMGRLSKVSKQIKTVNKACKTQTLF